MVDIVALKAKLAARKLAETGAKPVSITDVLPANLVTTNEIIKGNAPTPAVTSTIVATASIGTERTSEIDHLDFLSKVQELQDALIHTHPHMPVLLMKIHKQLSSDPELVSVLKEEEIGIIVSALKIQTKTELTGTLVKQSKAKDKKAKLDVSLF